MMAEHTDGERHPPDQIGKGSMKATYLWLTRLIAVGVVLQAAFVAYGTFEILNGASHGKAFTGDSEYNTGQLLHSIFGVMIIPALALILLIVSFFARIPG